MVRVSAASARKEFAETLNRVAYSRERVVLHRRGKDVAALVPMDDLELLRQMEDHLDLAAARKAMAEARKKGTIPWEKLKTELGL